MQVDYERCRAAGHTMFDNGYIWFCLVCHQRTDDSFAAHSRRLLLDVLIKKEAA